MVSEMAAVSMKRVKGNTAASATAADRRERLDGSPRRASDLGPDEERDEEQRDDEEQVPLLDPAGVPRGEDRDDETHPEDRRDGRGEVRAHGGRLVAESDEEHARGRRRG